MSEILAPGKYRARPIAWALGLSKGGKEQAEVAFELLDEAHVGVTRTWTGSFNPGKATEITFKALQACGFEGVDLNVLAEKPPPDVEVSLVIEHEDYQGKTYEKIRWVNKPYSGMRTTPMDEGTRLSFAERMRATLAGLDMEQASKGGDSPPDDLPF